MSYYNPYESPLARAIREAAEKEAREKALLRNLFALCNPAGLSPNILGDTRRKVFISYHHGNEEEVKDFIKHWTETNKVFIPRMLGVSDDDDFIDSDDPGYVMSQIREKYLQDTSVTIVFLGSCTHSRRYVDWEIKATLRQASNSLPSGLIAILLPSAGTSAHLPPRLSENWNRQNNECYARYYYAPSTASQLKSMIEDAFQARETRAKYINNSSDMKKYNAKCLYCGVTH